MNSKLPFAERDPFFHPISPYAASKLACEALGHVYHHVYGMDVTSCSASSRQSDGFVVDQEIIALAVAACFRIAKIAVPTVLPGRRRRVSRPSSTGLASSQSSPGTLLGLRRSRRFDSLRARCPRLS